MHAYTEQLVRACHRRGAHAIGGMAAFIPSRDAAVNEQAFARVREDKEREAGQGFDGTWVAHPAPCRWRARSSMRRWATAPTRRSACARTSCPIRPPCCRSIARRERSRSRACSTNVSVGLRYLDAWLGGVGAAAIDNLMEDAATAEISRAQLWQWVKNGHISRRQVRDEIAAVEAGDEAKELFASLALADQLEDFLTVPAYERLD